MSKYTGGINFSIPFFEITQASLGKMVSENKCTKLVMNEGGTWRFYVFCKCNIFN